MKFTLPIIVILLFSVACATADKNPANTVANATKPAAQPQTNPPQPKDGDYFGKGKVTKINNDLGSVELDHGDVPGLMPAMLMEFYVSDKALLAGTRVGDTVEFTILYKGGTETITKLAKTK